MDVNNALLLVKRRLNKMTNDHQQDDYLISRIEAAQRTLANIGIHLVDTPDDLMLLVDYTVWSYNNRDTGGTMPEWLKQARRERWLNDRKIRTDYQKEQEEVTGCDP